MALLTFEDVTELQAARRRSTLLAEASSHLGQSLDPIEVAASVAEATVPAFADLGIVELLQPDGSLARDAMAVADPAKRPIAEEYVRLYPLDMDSPVGSPQVIRSGEPQLMAELPPDFVELAAPDPRQREVLEGMGFTSIMIVPLRARGRVIGDLALAMAESGRRYGEEDLALAQQLADRCALALDNARLYAELTEAVVAAHIAGRRGQHDPRRGGRRGHRPGARRHAGLRQRGRGGDHGLRHRRGAAVRGAGPDRLPLRDDRRGRRAALDRAAPGAPRDGRRASRAARRPQPHGRHPRVALVAREGDAGVRATTAACGSRST